MSGALFHALSCFCLSCAPSLCLSHTPLCLSCTLCLSLMHCHTCGLSRTFSCALYISCDVCLCLMHSLSLCLSWSQAWCVSCTVCPSLMHVLSCMVCPIHWSGTLSVSALCVCYSSDPLFTCSDIIFKFLFFYN